MPSVKDLRDCANAAFRMKSNDKSCECDSSEAEDMPDGSTNPLIANTDWADQTPLKRFSLIRGEFNGRPAWLYIGKWQVDNLDKVPPEHLDIIERDQLGAKKVTVTAFADDTVDGTVYWTAAPGNG